MKSSISVTSMSDSSPAHRDEYLNLEPAKSNLSLFRTRSPIHPDFMIGYPEDSGTDLSYESGSFEPMEVKVKEWDHRPIHSDDPTTMVVNRILAHEKEIHNEVIRSWIEGITDQLPDLTSFTTSSSITNSEEKIDELDGNFLEDPNLGIHSKLSQPVLRRTQSLGQLSFKKPNVLMDFDGLQDESVLQDLNLIKKTYRCTISSVRNWMENVALQVEPTMIINSDD